MTLPARRGGAQIIPRPEGWLPGAPPPWIDVPDAARFGFDAVLASIAARPPRAAEDVDPPTGARPSAVLVALHDGPRGTEVVLTRRSWHLRNHKGEIAFPGGRAEPGEAPETTALREAHEEVAMPADAVELIGRLTPLTTILDRSTIVPVVGALLERPLLRPAVAEVERILHVPLAVLADPEIFHEERWAVEGGDYAVYFFELEDETVWGATARMLIDLLSVVLGVAT